LGWPFDTLESFQIGPTFERYAIPIKEFPPQVSCETEPGIICCTSAKTDHTATHPTAGDCSQQRPQTSRVQLERMKLTRRQHCQANHAGRFNNGAEAISLQPPPHMCAAARCILYNAPHWPSAGLAGQHSAKAIATVGNGHEGKFILRARTAPTAPKGPSHLTGRQSSLELIRGNEHAHSRTMPDALK